MNYWMVTISEENFRITRNLGVSQHGFGSSQRRKTERMRPGDRLLFYIRETQRFAATATVASPPFEDRTPVWKGPQPGEALPYRVHLRPSVILQEPDSLDARMLAPRLEYVKRWPPERWPLAFQGELHLLPRKDFEVIEREMQKAAGGRSAPGEMARAGV
ncbi:MAG: EVE domain-containing protein [Chloroflexi bacterium]|nr:EVE domain-containing protein [Chloroflexota bacterium]